MSRAGCCALTASILRLSSESNNPLVSTITPFGSTKSGVYTDVNTYVSGTDSYSKPSPRWLRLAATDASKPDRYRLEVEALAGRFSCGVERDWALDRRCRPAGFFLKPEGVCCSTGFHQVDDLYSLEPH